MGYDVVIKEVAARPMAAVHVSVPVGHVATVWRPALDKVWAFLRQHEHLRTDGHNIFMYRHPVRSGAPIEADFGVEVSGPFADAGEVVFTSTPAGRVATTVHIRPIYELARAKAAIEAWCREHG